MGNIPLVGENLDCFPYQSMMKVLLAKKIREELNLEEQSEKIY